jgi:hypothetical protein
VADKPSGRRGAALRLIAEYGEAAVNAVRRVLGNGASEASLRKGLQSAGYKPIKGLQDNPAIRAIQQAATPPTNTFVQTKVPDVPPLPGKGGKSRRKTTPAEVLAEASARTRAEAKARMSQGSPAERRAAREPYTIGPLSIDLDPALRNFSLKPGSGQSVTSQAAEQGFPVEGAAPFFAQHSSGYSTSWGDQAPTPMNFSAEYRDRTPEPDVPLLNEEAFPVGSGLFRMLGDATMANRDVLSVNGVPLVNPVSTYGGPRYGYQEQAVGNPLVWASDAGVEENEARMIRDWQNANPGQPLFGMHVNMGPSGSDFSHQTSAILANLIPNMDLSGDQLRLIDKYIRSGAEGLPDFAGFADDPALGLFDIVTRPGGDRKLITKRLANVTKEAQMAGVPGNLGALARLAVAEPGLRLAPLGSTGFSVAKIDPENFLRVDPALLSGAKRRLFEKSNEYASVLGEPVDFMRPDYNAGISGTMMGQMQSLIPVEIPFGPVFDRAKQITKSGTPTTSTMKFKSFATDPNSIITVTPEIQDKLGQYLYDVSKYKRLGWAEGGLAELSDKYEV